MTQRLETGDQASVTEVSGGDAGKPVRIPRPWAFWPLRIVALFETVLMFDQSVYAGRFLSGDFPALHVHRENATYTGIVLLVELVAAIVLRWPGRGPSWPIWVIIGLFGLVALQIVVGFSRTLVLHVPLGVSLIVLTVLMLVWAWRPKAHDWWPGGLPGGGEPAAAPAPEAEDRSDRTAIGGEAP